MADPSMFVDPKEGEDERSTSMAIATPRGKAGNGIPTGIYGGIMKMLRMGCDVDQQLWFLGLSKNDMCM